MGFEKVDKAVMKLQETAAQLSKKMNAALMTQDFSDKELKTVNQQLLALEKSFLEDKGMYFGSWYKSLYAASDPFSGYASWILPGLEYEIALKASNRLPEWDTRYSDAIFRLESKMAKLIGDL